MKEKTDISLLLFLLVITTGIMMVVILLIPIIFDSIIYNYWTNLHSLVFLPIIFFIFVVALLLSIQIRDSIKGGNS